MVARTFIALSILVSIVAVTTLLSTAVLILLRTVRPDQCGERFRADTLWKLAWFCMFLIVIAVICAWFAAMAEQNHL